MIKKITIGDYLLLRLKELGIQHIFGVAGDYNLGFLDQIIYDKDIKWIGTCNELNGAYAADGYARVKGASALVTTFGVGELSAINGIAGAYAENVPIVHIVGYPSTTLSKKQMLMHHTLGDGQYHIFENIFNPISAYKTILNNKNAATEIDKAIYTCWFKKKPVYIGIPTDISYAEIEAPTKTLQLSFPASDNKALNDFVEQAAQLIEKAKSPALLIDFYVDRHDMDKYILNFIEQTGIPFTSLAMGKAILDETHPQFIGIYGGIMGDATVQKKLDSADCIITFGTLLSDANSGGFTVKIDPQARIEINSNQASIKQTPYTNIFFPDVMQALSKRLKNYHYKSKPIKSKNQEYNFEDKPITQKRFWPLITNYLKRDSIVIAETGTSMFGIINIPMPQGTIFIAQLLWGSIGYSVGSLLGALIAAPHRSAVLFVGDGSFQLTAQEISTILRHRLTPTIFLLDNDGYTIERFIRGATMPYNDIQHWHYKDLPFIFGDNVWATEVQTEKALEHALHERQEHRDKMAFIVVKMNKMDGPEELLKMIKQQKVDPYRAVADA